MAGQTWRTVEENTTTTRKVEVRQWHLNRLWNLLFLRVHDTNILIGDIGRSSLPSTTIDESEEECRREH